MRYLFFDLEYASSYRNIHKICEFGYVITDENFEVLARNNIIINPNIHKKQWDKRVVREILTRTIPKYEDSPIFPDFYYDIKKLIKRADYIFGHTINCDAKALNDECQRYHLESIDYDFIDTKIIYKEYSNKKKGLSVGSILEQLDIQGEGTIHDAETDAYNTMLGLKSVVEKLEMTIGEIIELCPKAKDRNENFTIKSVEENRIKQEKRYFEYLNGTASNDMKSWNKKRYIQFLDNVKPSGKGSEKFKDKKVSISINYEQHHFRQMLNLVQLIVNEGGQVILKASLADIFVKYEVPQEDGTLRRDSKLDFVNEANNNGAKIEIIDFSDLLKKLEITEVELDNLPPLPFNFLLTENVVIKSKKDKNIVAKKKEKMNRKNDIVYSSGPSHKVTLGDLFGDILKKFSDKNNNESN